MGAKSSAKYTCRRSDLIGAERQNAMHAGQIGGFYTESVVFLDNGFTLVVLTNDQDYDTDPFVFKILNAVCGSSQLDSNC